MNPQLTARSYLRTLACAALLLVGQASPGLAQSPKLSTTGTYQATLTCSGGDTHFDVGQLQVWDAGNQALPIAHMSCDGSYQVGPGATKMHYAMFVIDSTGVQQKQCENPSTSAIKEGRFICKGGKLSMTLTIEPK